MEKIFRKLLHIEKRGIVERGLDRTGDVGARSTAEIFASRESAHKKSIEYSISIQDVSESMLIPVTNYLTVFDSRWKQALEYHVQFLMESPKNHVALNNKGVILRVLGRLDEALLCINRALRLEPHFAVSWYNRGVLKSLGGEMDEALACLEMALELNPGFEDARLLKELTLEGTGDAGETHGGGHQQGQYVNWLHSHR